MTHVPNMPIEEIRDWVKKNEEGRDQLIERQYWFHDRELEAINLVDAFIQANPNPSLSAVCVFMADGVAVMGTNATPENLHFLHTVLRILARRFLPPEDVNV